MRACSKLFSWKYACPDAKLKKIGFQTVVIEGNQFLIGGNRLVGVALILEINIGNSFLDLVNADGIVAEQVESVVIDQCSFVIVKVGFE